jgi:prepilin-type N-terminal cleavage/methylation domain-containing protein
MRTMRARGFTIVEVMMVVGIIGTIVALAIPNYTRFTARAHRTEMRDAIAKLAIYFNGKLGDQTGYGSDIADVTPNPPSASPPPAPATWDPLAHGWSEVPVSMEGGVRMRYWYAISGGGTTLTLQATGNFPGVGPYVYSETYQSGSLILTTEVPPF